MADEKDTEATRLAPEKFIPEFNRLSVEGPNNDDDDGLVLKPKRKHGKTKIKIRLRKTSSEVSNKKELPKASSEVSNKKEEKKEEKKDEKKGERKWLEVSSLPYYAYYPYGASDYYGGSSHTGQHEYNREFGRDTNRLDAFPGRPFEVSYDPKYGESDYGGGHSGQQQHQQQSVSTIPPPDSNVTTQEENIPNIGSGTTENVHAEKSDIGQDKYTKLVHYIRRRELDTNGIWLGIQRQLLQLERQQAHIMNILQDFKGESHDGKVTLENRMWGLERVVEDMAHNLSLSMNNLKTSYYMNAFEESSGRSLSKYNGFSDYKSRGSSWNHQTHTRSTQIGLRKGGGPVRCGEGPSARSVSKASNNEATLEAIRGAAPEVSGTENPVKNRDPGLAGWKTAMDGVRAGDMDMAFGEVLSSGDDLLLVKLMDKTGPVIDRLSGEVASEVLHAVAQFLLEPNLFGICLSWIQQLLDMSVANGIDVVRIPTEVKTEILVNLNEASSTIDPPENWEGLIPNQLFSQLASVWDMNLQQLHK